MGLLTVFGGPFCDRGSGGVSSAEKSETENGKKTVQSDGKDGSVR